MPPTPRKSQSELRLTGHWRKDRHGPIPPPEGKPLGKPPRNLAPDIQRAWRDIAAAGDGRLVQADAVVVEVAARCLAAVRGPDAKGLDTANLLRSLAALQLDAAHRRALAKPAAPNEFDQF
ncbi:MAG: hypothetical protein ACSLE2_12810 [Lysobacterales bacterium]